MDMINALVEVENIFENVMGNTYYHFITIKKDRKW